jgi:DNA-binding GntR family transcriptional regulator
VDQAVEAIIGGASRGLILPGDRIVESAVAAGLGISRVPVREALRLLESQGLVFSEPYKGIRLMLVTQTRLEQATEARLALETTAARRALKLGRHRDGGRQRLTARLHELELMAARQDTYGCARADTDFHRELCGLSGNEVLCGLWEQLARQITIIVGLSTLGKAMDLIVSEHRVLLNAFTTGRPAALERALEEHIRTQNAAIDFEALIEERRRRRDCRCA